MTGARFSGTRARGGAVRGRVAVAAAGLGAAWVAGYLFLIYQQGATEFDTPMTVFLATFVGVMALLALGAAIAHRRNEQWAQAMLYASAAGFIPAGVIGLMSIGLPLIVVGMLALGAAGPRRIPARLAVAAGALPAIMFVIWVGVALTIRVP